MAVTSSTVVYWNPEIVYAPILEAHAVATVEAAATAQKLAPGRITVRAVPSSIETAELKASGPGAVFQEYGARPHEIDPKRGGVLAGKGFGPVSGPVAHPGNPALHFTRIGAESYPEAFVAAARARFPG